MNSFTFVYHGGRLCLYDDDIEKAVIRFRKYKPGAHVDKIEIGGI
jgi:hypothetical protein